MISNEIDDFLLLNVYLFFFQFEKFVVATERKINCEIVKRTNCGIAIQHRN